MENGFGNDESFKGELIQKDTGMISLVKDSELGDMIKPLIKEIHLFDSFVAGTTHLADKSVLAEIKTGDMLNLTRENNKFDENAIIITTDSKKKVGYVPEKDNIIFARLMDAGKLLKAKIADIEQKGSFTKIRIGIYLVDF